MNNERPMDILDAIINKKLYKSVYTKQADDMKYKVPPPTSSTFLTSEGILHGRSPKTPAVPGSKPRYSEPGSSSTERSVSTLPGAPSREISATPTTAGISSAGIGLDRPAGSTPVTGEAIPTAPTAPTAPAVPAVPAAPAPSPEPDRDTAEARRASLWEGARFYTGPGQEIFAVLTTHDAKQLLEELGVNFGDRELVIDQPVLLNLKNGSRALVFKGPDGNENVVIGFPNLLGAKIPDGNLEPIHPYLYNIMTSKPSNDRTNVLAQLQGDQSKAYDPTMLILRLLIELLRESRNDGNRNNNSEANQLAKSILGNIQHIPKIEPTWRRVS